MAVSSTNLSPVSELLIALDRDGGVALHRQIEASIRERIRTGALPGGVALPPSRALAAGLGVSRGVVVEAYAQLVAEGYLTSRSGGYTQVAPAAAEPGRAAPAVAPAAPRPRLRAAATRPAVDFGYGRANVGAFPARRLAALRTAGARPRRPTSASATSTGAARWSYGRRWPPISTVCAARWPTPRRSSSPMATPRRCRLLMGVLAARGAKTLAVEDPSPSDDARPIAEALGLDVVSVPVGEDGVRLDAVSELRPTR